MKHLPSLLLLFLAALSCFARPGPQFTPAQPAASPQDQQPGPPGTIRVRVRLIPVDVIVTDQRDNPITDLKQDDFQVFENGRAQEIRHFSIQKFQDAAPALKPQTERVPTPELAPQPARTFLFLLGRGRHQTPLKAVDSLIQFVRKELLPQDRVAVFAYNSATDFTTEHERIAQVLERYKKSNEKLESWLELRFRGLATVYGIRTLPKSMQVEIDRVFVSPGVSTRQVPPGRITEKGSIVRDWDRSVDKMIKDSDTAAEADARQVVADEVAEAGGQGSQIMQALIKFDTLDSTFTMLSLPFDQYAPLASSSFQDLQNLYTCIEYLRYMEGEKHLLYFSGDGLLFPNGDVDYDRGLVAIANDARVTINAFQTGGVFVDPDMLPRVGITLPAPTKGSTAPVFPPPSEVSPSYWSRTFMAKAMTNVSQLTGGRSSITSDIGKSLDNLNKATRVEYLLGYYPTDDRWNGKYRQIHVKVNRPGTKVSSRRGYFARDTLRPFDREEFLAFSRISAAGSYELDINDVPFKVATTKNGGAAPQIRVDLQIDSEKIGFKMVDLRHVGRLRCAIFYADGGGNSLGDIWQNMNLELAEAKYQEYLRTGIPLAVNIPWKASNQLLKIVVYDAIGDRIGSKLVKVR